ncbi:ATPase, F1 complex, gamma subunit domain-containing protein [Yarrowia lipolytica]|uniref:ATP synthase subunit gamma, mitochondrial n=2 Tax=Yarrowia lipolytica TaxID=4952 RepID=ATPG_YARLI|nr:YALI0F02893p [Yarrowia lipolytica CLIB122]Q6C338.2 RecName: Full=ATP synthase subunit gamma, mitochondrial; AltName: Full=F-ATPase gamma subunit; Flags: Precursor [Yarrowia lipolytica CLIB122]5FL7_G Chain G, ATP SYNTHASE SUBUNIT GAMMA CHAIN, MITOCHONDRIAL [Yarrowia lipolytica]AOW06561.1 hypothetical protein YALI1_F04110g [Yarrowia lipolytica]KAB8282124.1 ATPase, F1 complex, gamma subunit domain-containing protein [Yarrowia lipolytica]KAE8172017.1 ATPase, F1 complex, gamma subunit domain-con|eukprot:XP_504924.2 YALI0F02893p [Yarrowia lipolytica CLIB122]
MFALRTAARPAARSVGATRNYATLREIEMRLKSIKNIEKITNTMKIVASTKLGKAQRAMATSKVYNEASEKVFENSETAVPENIEKRLWVVVSSDKGLCGSIHSQLARTVRRKLLDFESGEKLIDIVAVGEKIKAQLGRSNPEQMRLSFGGTGKEAPTFEEAAHIADEILALDTQYDDIEIVYNKVLSGISFEPIMKESYSAKAIEDAPKFGQYELEDDVVKNLADFSLANTIYAAMAEGHAAEISARRNAMDNASKNASDMINKYSILYNRTRQAVITNELVDIITGASSLE